jgi:hypothetical protein
MSNFPLIEECTESSAIGFSCLIPVKNFDQVLLMKKIGSAVSSGSSNLVAYPTHARTVSSTHFPLISGRRSAGMFRLIILA